MSKFAIVPLAVLSDTRLTKNDLKVLIALLSFMNKKTRSCFPGRRAISARCGLAETRISEVTTRLEKFGWIKKSGRGGHSKSVTYTFQVPPHLQQNDCAATQSDQQKSNVPSHYYEENQQNYNRKFTTNNQKLSAVERVRLANEESAFF